MTYPGTKPRVPSAIESSLISRVTELEKERAWIPVSERMPEAQKYVLAYYKNRLGHGRRIRAYYAPKHTVEDGGEYQGDADYVEEADTYYYPEGWYECNEHEEVNWRVDEEVTHWMPLPKPPSSSAGS